MLEMTFFTVFRQISISTMFVYPYKMVFKTTTSSITTCLYGNPKAIQVQISIKLEFCNIYVMQGQIVFLKSERDVIVLVSK